MHPKPNSYFKSLLILLFLLASMHAIAQQPAANQPVKVNLTPNAPNNTYRAKYTFTVLTGSNNSFGYDILKNGIVILHQPAEVSSTRPISLKSAIQAQRAAMFVIYKMRNNIHPVTLSDKDLQKVTIN